MKLMSNVLRLFAYLIISQILRQHGIRVLSIEYWAVMLLVLFTCGLSFREGLKS